MTCLFSIFALHKKRIVEVRDNDSLHRVQFRIHKTAHALTRVAVFLFYTTMDNIKLSDLPNKVFYYIAKEYLKKAYPKVHKSFFSFEISKRKNTITCFNGGAIIDLHISYFEGKYRIKRKGSYALHRRVDSAKIIADAVENAESIKEYFKVRSKRSTSTNVRCVNNVEEGKKKFIRDWNYNYPNSKITEETIDWVVEKV
jgi:hypothetical protein